jgi:hypothetical protein
LTVSAIESTSRLTRRDIFSEVFKEDNATSSFAFAWSIPLDDLHGVFCNFRTSRFSFERAFFNTNKSLAFIVSIFDFDGILKLEDAAMLVFLELDSSVAIASDRRSKTTKTTVFLNPLMLLSLFTIVNLHPKINIQINHNDGHLQSEFRFLAAKLCQVSIGQKHYFFLYGVLWATLSRLDGECVTDRSVWF